MMAQLRSITTALIKTATKFQLGMAHIADAAPTIILGVGNDMFELRRLVPHVPDDLLSLIERWPAFADVIGEAADTVPQASLDVSQLTWLVPVMPRKLICAGANYQDHNREMLGAVAHEFPYTFLKPPTTTIVPSGQAVPLPAHAVKIDYEAELAAVMGAQGDVFGYTILNDLSARDWIPGATFLGLDWVMLKGFDGSAPMGPWITPAAFVPEPQALRITLTVNGDMRQDGSTSNMVFTVRQLVDHLARFVTFEAGDVIATGTPSGVGMGRKPPEYLNAGDNIRIEIEGLGVLQTTMAARRETASAHSLPAGPDRR